MPAVATHYPTPAAKCADLVVHLAGLACALLGGGILLGLDDQAWATSAKAGLRGEDIQRPHQWCS
ncbi:hypothetical protein ACRAWD_24190 [Caulobacter segnis]